MADALAIRFLVFVEEQGFPPEDEIDEHDRDDPAARHALVREGVAAVAAGRFYDAGSGTAQIGRLAVLAQLRGRGIGAALLGELVGAARRGGFARARLLAQLHAREFYRRAGFADDGELVSDAGVPHQPMVLDFSRTNGPES
jgi:predicted GNAT family N-acyltransferase